MPTCTSKLIECIYWDCDTNVPLREIFDHLKNAHDITDEETQYEDGFITWEVVTTVEPGYITPNIVTFQGQTFFLQGCVALHDMRFWVITLGASKDACNYEISMSIQDGTERDGFELRGRIFSIDEEKIKAPRNQEGVLKLGKAMAENFSTEDADGLPVITLDFQIIRK